MNSRIIYALIVILLLAVSSLSSQTVTFQQEFDMPGEAVMNSSHIGTYDGGMMVLNYSYNTTTSVQSLTFIKTTATGTVQWTKRFSPVTADYENFVQTADSGYFICYTNYGVALGRYQLLKLDAAGNVVFSHRLAAPAPYAVIGQPHTVAKKDGGFYIASDLYDTLTNIYQWHLFEISATGNLLWSHCYNVNPSKGYHTDIDTCQNGDIVLVGSVFDPVTQLHSLVITRIAPGGAELWTKYYSVTAREIVAIAFVCMPGDQFMILGSTWGPVSFQNEVILMKTDGQGNEVWTFAFSDVAISLESNALERGENDRAVILGTTGTGAFMIKTDTTGLMLCRRSYPDQVFLSMDTLAGAVYSFSGMNFTSSNSVLMTTDQCGVGCDDSLFTVIKTPLTVQEMSAGINIAMSLADTMNVVPTVFATVHSIEICSTVGMDEPVGNNHQNVYPVPAADVVHVQSSEIVLSADLIDINGKIIRTTTVNSTSFDLDVSDLTAGIYFLRMYEKNETSSRKIIVQH